MDKNERDKRNKLAGSIFGVILVLLGVLAAGVGYVVAKAKNFIGNKED